MEAIADPDEKGCYEFNIVGKIISPENLIRSVIADWRQGISKNVISARFHNGAAEMVLNNCLIQKKKHHISNVVLSGGVWQNILLLTNTLALLRNEGFNVFTHHQVPTNDGGIALGQAVIAAKMIEEA